MFRGSSGRALWLIVALGAALRLFPIWFGLPYPHARPDENTALGTAILLVKGDPNPHFFHWPSLIFYLFAALHTVASLVKRIVGAGVLTDTEFVLLARACVAVAGTLTVVPLFRLARRIADQATGLLAAMFLAVAILHVRESHFALTDVVMTMLVTIALALLVRGLDERGPGDAGRWFAAAGMCGGLAASTKYSAAAIATAMVAAQLMMLVRSRLPIIKLSTWLPSIAFGCLFVFGFVVATPYAVLDFESVAEAIQYDFTHLSGGHALDLGRGWSNHLLRSLPFGLGPALFAAGVAGFVPLLGHYPLHGVPIAAFAVALYVSLASGQTVFFRYILPLVPIFCLTAALFVRHAALWLGPRVPLTPAGVTAVLVILIAGPSAVNSVWFDILLARTDTRVLAAEWLIPRVRAEESLYDAGGDYTRLHLGDAPIHRWAYDDETNSFGDPDGRIPEWLILPESPLLAYAAVPQPLRELARSRYEPMWIVRGTTGRGRAAYDQQDAFFMPLSGFHTVRRPGPTIHIYRRSGTR